MPGCSDQGGRASPADGLWCLPLVSAKTVNASSAPHRTQRRKAQNLGTDALGSRFGSTAIQLCDLDQVPLPQFPSLETGPHDNPTMGDACLRRAGLCRLLGTEQILIILPLGGNVMIRSYSRRPGGSTLSQAKRALLLNCNTGQAGRFCLPWLQSLTPQTTLPCQRRQA